MRKIATYVTAVLLAAAPAWSQSVSGSVTGVIEDVQGGVLPGATVTLSGKTGSRTTTSDSSGQYRFVGLDPGTYSVSVQLQEFAGKRRDNVQVSIGREARVDFSLSLGGVTAELTVVAEAPVVDTKSSATDNTLSQDLLFNMPIRPTNAATQLLNYLPGINSGSAYGGDSDTANGLLLDGVDTRDPEGGSAWTFFNFHIVDEVQVSGLGAPAEFGAFTGAVVNTITKSGGNTYKGLFDIYYTNDDLASNNVKQAHIDANPSLEDPSIFTKQLDGTAQLSGPIVKDKLFFFASAQRFERRQNPSGPLTVRNEVSPRFNVKLNWQPTPNDSFMGMFQSDDYNIIGRAGVPIALATDELTNREDAPELVWATQWRRLFGSRTFLEVKYTGWAGYFDLNPEVEAPSHFDGTSGLYSDSQGWFFYADRGRHQVNASLSHYAEWYGKHDFKFGLEVERSRVRNRFGYVNDIYYYDYTTYYPKGQYLAYDYGYDIEGRNQRESAYAQDSWKVNDRLTLNLGVRFDSVRGHPAGASRTAGGDTSTVYSLKNWAPRLGFAWDVTGDNKTVLKGHYGRYYEGAFFLAWSAAVTGVEDFVGYFYDPTGSKCGPAGNCFVEFGRSPSPVYDVDRDIKHPRVDELILGLERALTSDVRLSVTGVWREDKNLQGSVIPGARWARTEVANGLTNQPLTVYTWVNRDASENEKLLTNPDGFQYRDAQGNVLGAARAERKYKALMFVLDKRLSNRWLGRVSYVLSKAEGTQDNDGFDTYGKSTLYESPSRALVNRFGAPTNDPRHELKVFLGYEVPKADVSVNAYWRRVSGRTFTPFQQFGSSTINFSPSSGRRVFLEPAGSRRNETQSILDLRVEKVFRLAGSQRLALYADLNNALNTSAVFASIDRYPSQAIAGVGDVDFGAPSRLIDGRQVFFGARWSF